MGSSQQLVPCPKCKCTVHFERLKTHLQKVHKSQEHGNDKPVKQTSISSGALTITKFKQVSVLINSWLRRYKDYLYNSDNVKILTIMALENFMGYSFDEINELYNGKIDKERYEVGTKRFKITYEQMMAHLHRNLLHHSKYYIAQQSRDQYYSHDNGERGNYVDWYVCNSVDRMDGSKYIGYHRREYEDSRFGSFPVHDDYGEESWADDNPWE